MKSLTANVKDEIVNMPSKECCRTALLSAIIHSAGSISFSKDGVGVIVNVEHPEVLSLTSKLIEALYGANVNLTRDKLEARGDYVFNMLLDLGILVSDGREVGAYAGINGFVVADRCCIKSYLRGLFLGCGSVSVAKKYHLEMSFSTSNMASDVCALIGDYGIAVHSAVRKDRYLVYIKSVDGISDFFALIGAAKTVLSLANTAALRLVNSDTNRRINCDLANTDKVVEASMRQIEAINKIKNTISDEKLREVAIARLDHPDFSYEGLAELLNVSKGCIKYRLSKLVELAEDKEDRQ